MLNPGSLIYAFIHSVGGINHFGAGYLWFLIAGTISVAIWRIRCERRVRWHVASLTSAVEHSDDPPRAAVSGWFADHPKSPLKLAWDQYLQALQHEDGADNKPDPLRFFSDQAIVFGMANHRATEVMPGLLTMAGILGTFLGLVAGLHGLNPSAPNGLGAGIGQLVGGLSLKFTSSVYGILGALIWTVVDRLFWSPRFYQAVWELQDQLDAKLGVPTEELLLQQIRTIQVDQKESLATLVSDVLIPQLVGGISSTIRETLVPELRVLGEQQQATTEGIQSFSRDMGRIAENTSQTQMDGLEHIAQNLVGQMGQQTVELARALHDALQETIQTQESLTGSVHQLLEQSGPMFATLQATASLQQAAFVESQAIHATLMQSADFWNQFHVAMRETIQDAEQRMRALFTAAESRVVEMAQQFEASGEGLFSQLEGLVRSTSEYAGTLLEERRLLEAQFASLQDGQSQYMADMRDAVEVLPGLVKAFATSATDIERHASESFATWQENISRDLTSLSEMLFRQVDSQLAQFNGIQERMGSQFASATDRFEAVANQLAEAAGDVRRASEDALERLQQDLSAGLKVTFTQFDDELSQAVGHLAEGVHQVESAVKTLGNPTHALGQSTELLQREAESFIRALRLVSRQVERDVAVAEGQ